MSRLSENCATRAVLSVRSHRTDGLRLLALHSFRTSANIFKAQMRRAGWLEDENESEKDTRTVNRPSGGGNGKVEIVFLDAPFEASGEVPQPIRNFFPNDSYREWWNASDDGQEYRGLNESISYVDTFMKKEGPFHGVIGFSQGGSFAAFLCALQQELFTSGILSAFPSMPSSVLSTNHFEFCICICGLKSRIREHQYLYEKHLKKIPSLHFLGSNDSLTPLSRKLVACFGDPKIVNHSRGHVVPPLSDADGKQSLERFLNEQYPKL